MSETDVRAKRVGRKREVWVRWTGPTTPSTKTTLPAPGNQGNVRVSANVCRLHRRHRRTQTMDDVECSGGVWKAPVYG